MFRIHIPFQRIMIQPPVSLRIRINQGSIKYDIPFDSLDIRYFPSSQSTVCRETPASGLHDTRHRAGKDVAGPSICHNLVD